jgi:peptidoglycan/xylan/chitin deacetylase (PgdA/CDA1 family)
MMPEILICVMLAGGITMAQTATDKAAGNKPDDPNGIILKPIPEKVVVLTFDDNCVSHATFVGPLLKKLGFGGTFYITEAFPDKKMYMSWEQIKSLEDLGFEIGNHSVHHPAFSSIKTEECLREIAGIENDCATNRLARPTTFCWPGYGVNNGIFTAMAEKGYLFARGGHERPYAPATDNPFDTPSFTVHDGTLKDKDSFVNAAKQAVPGKIVIFTFHGVPDPEHPWVKTEPASFEECMKYLKDNNYTVIAMRDMAKYVDAAKAVKYLAK